MCLLGEMIYVLRDDYDQSTICVVEAENAQEAIDWAVKAYADHIDGDLYAAFVGDLHTTDE